MDLTNQYVGITSSYDQDAFGNVLEGTASDYHLTTKDYNLFIGLYYFFYRWYDSKLGRYTQKDIFSGFKTDPQSLNNFTYNENNPINSVDILGLMCETIKTSTKEEREELWRYLLEDWKLERATPKLPYSPPSPIGIIECLWFRLWLIIEEITRTTYYVEVCFLIDCNIIVAYTKNLPPIIETYIDIREKREEKLIIIPNPLGILPVHICFKCPPA